MGGAGRGVPFKNSPWNTRYKWRVKNISYCENFMFSLSVWVLLNAVKLQSMVVYLLLIQNTNWNLHWYSSLNPLALLLLIIAFFHKQFEHLLLHKWGWGYYIWDAPSQSPAFVYMYHFDRKGTSFVDLSLQRVHVPLYKLI